MRLLPSGERAVLVELAGIEEVLALAEPVRSLPGVEDVVPGECTLLVTVVAPADLPVVGEAVAGIAGFGGHDGVRAPLSGVTGAGAARTGAGPVAAGQETLEIGVVYDGPDLEEVAALTGLSVPEVVEAHTGTPWRVAFGGFAPGFAYLVGGDPRLDVPRRAQARPSVPAGAVGLAGRYSGVYPRSSPGGWQIVGRTDLVLFEVDRDPPALLRPGMTVRFVARRG